MWGLFAPATRENGPQTAKPAKPNAISTVVSSDGPRPKAPANKPRLLPRWEACSDDENEPTADDGSDSGEPDSPGANRSRRDSGLWPASRETSVADNHEQLALVAGGNSDRLPPLRSYEESVLNLVKRARPKKVQDTDQEEVSVASTEDKDPKDALEKIKNNLKFREKMLEEERIHKLQEMEADTSTGVNALSASRVIVGVARVKLNIMKQKMKVFEEAEFQGTQGNVRAKRLFEWAAVLSVLSQFDKVMATPAIMAKKKEVYIKSLPPPPPPPPPEEPPDSEDEELHEKYETMIRKYETQWQKEGQRVLGMERFEEIRNMRTAVGPAAKEKKLIAQRCLQQAHEVLDEAEHQELLRKAWRLGDDHMALNEYNPDEFARQHANMKGNGSSGDKKGSADASRQAAKMKNAGSNGGKNA